MSLLANFKRMRLVKTPPPFRGGIVESLYASAFALSPSSRRPPVSVGELLSVAGLRFGHGRGLLFDGFSLSVREGAIVALIGPNGAGKSTLMRCLTGVIRPSAGDIRIAGRSLADEPDEARRQIGYLPDDFGLFDKLTAADHLRFAARAYGEADIVAAVGAAARAADLADLLERLPRQLSRGQRQRLGIAMAIIHRPPLLLLDEPASGLDPLARAHLARLLRRLRADGATIVVSSHILTELREYATEYIILDNGRVEDGGELERTSDWRIRVDDSEAAVRALRESPAVADWREQDDGAIVARLTDADAAPALLKSLALADAGVREYAPFVADIEDIYLRRLR